MRNQAYSVDSASQDMILYFMSSLKACSHQPYLRTYSVQPWVDLKEQVYLACPACLVTRSQTPSIVVASGTISFQLFKHGNRASTMRRTTPADKMTSLLALISYSNPPELTSTPVACLAPLNRILFAKVDLSICRLVVSCSASLR